jgi:hypothetical protein
MLDTFVELKLFCHPSSSTIFTVNTRFPSCSELMVFKMAEDRRAMYDEFSDKGAHSTEWFEVAKNFLKLVLLVIVMKRSAHTIGVETEGCYLSMRCLVTLLSTDLCRTT